jgi:RNA polymerase subunit RPABC4/transcription elongation factor Spt4/energy-coupling factor transporter transmembrane protein EcfT
MTETEESKKPLIQEFKDMTPKQWIATLLAFVVSAALVLSGLYFAMCMGFFIIAVLLYMLPHLAGVTSPRIKAVVGAVFVVMILLVGTFAYGDSAKDAQSGVPTNKILTDVTFDGTTITVVTDQATYGITVSFSPVTAIAYGQPSSYDANNVKKVDLTDQGGKYTGTLALEQGKYYYIEVAAPLDEAKSNFEHYTIFYNTGISSDDVRGLNFAGAIVLAGEIALIFFVMLIFSELMRWSAKRSRKKMEEEGRLYPQGYGKCKKCGAMVLPGEINCRKCGEAIDVPEDVKVLHKKDFFECSECGTEVPNDAKFCPKCGAVFDEADETVIKHADGTVDSSTETFECSECGKVVPANAKRCPYCGAEFDEDDN